jgi:hypothetical protein
LIEGPLGAAILAKGIVTTQVASGQSKPESVDGAKAADLVNNDVGQADLGDLQYVLFNAVALTFFFGELLASPPLGLPSIPKVLVGLTSVSAVGYVAKKALPVAARAITKVDPDTVPIADWQGGASRAGHRRLVRGTDVADHVLDLRHLRERRRARDTPQRRDRRRIDGQGRRTSRHPTRDPRRRRNCQKVELRGGRM